eukprot:Platyproteum_vivax@DN8560_c0_g1_i1.p1
MMLINGKVQFGFYGLTNTYKGGMNYVYASCVRYFAGMIWDIMRGMSKEMDRKNTPLSQFQGIDFTRDPPIYLSSIKVPPFSAPVPTSYIDVIVAATEGIVSGPVSLDAQGYFVPSSVIPALNEVEIAPGEDVARISWETLFNVPTLCRDVDTIEKRAAKQEKQELLFKNFPEKVHYYALLLKPLTSEPVPRNPDFFKTSVTRKFLMLVWVEIEVFANPHVESTLESFVDEMEDGGKYIFKRVPEYELYKLKLALLEKVSSQRRWATRNHTNILKHDNKNAVVHITMKPRYI